MSAEDALLALATDVAREAGAGLREAFGQVGLAVASKSTPTDLVSEADVGTERRIAQEKEQRAMSESFTYAIPRRRLYWFEKGFNSARIEDCDTFDSESQ